LEATELKPKGKEPEDFKRIEDLESRDDLLVVALKLREEGMRIQTLLVDRCW